MLFLNVILKRNNILAKFNNIKSLHKFKICKFHVKCTSSIFSSRSNYFRKRKYIKNEINKKDKKNVLWNSKDVQLCEIKKKKLTNYEVGKKRKKFRINYKESLFSEKINIDLLNEELKSIEQKIKEKNLIKNKEKDLSILNFKYPTQKFYKANEEEINLLKKSETQYYLPIECENSTIIRLIDIKNKISSPIYRCVRNSKFGLREKERRFFFFYSSFICSFFFLMGVWQYKKMEKKKFLINYILHNLNKSILSINHSNFPWFDDFLALKKNYKNLNENFLKYENKSELLSNVSLINVKLFVLPLCKQIKSFCEKLFMKNLLFSNNANSSEIEKKNVNSDIYENSKNNEAISKEKYSEMENENKLNIDIENFHSVYDWIVRIRNENLFMKLYRKVFKKHITEDELKKLVIEKYKYRKIELTGVLDTSNEFYIGPKLHENKKNKMYYYVICPLFLKNGKCILVNRGLLSEDILEEKKNEIPKIVTIRAILDPGELYECSFKKLKNFSNKNKYKNYFFYYDTQEISQYANISQFEGSSYFIANIYDMIVHEDYMSDIKKDYYSDYNSNNTEELYSHLKKLNNIDIDDIDRESQENIKYLIKKSDNTKIYSSHFQSNKPFRYDEYFIHKKRKDYFQFYADENTHFNYACQWFLFSFIFSTISIFKFVQFKKWVF